MPKIHQLPPHVIAKIAAGEVIERPAYAVKELIENALDAKADYITIQLEEAGLKKIIVTDNGEGMSYEDIQECFKPHTTSKLSQEDDLTGITSLGFRGEALASIAAMSSVTIKSRTSDSSAGTIVALKAGNITKLSPVGTPIGTTVIVDHLFSHVPARKKFLKTPTTELRHSIETVFRYALAYPHIRFFLSHNKKTLLDLPKKQDMHDRLRIIFGNDITSNFIPLDHEASYLKISGFLAKPQVATYSQSKQFIFVNNRYITDKSIALSVKEGYGNLLEAKAYPVFVLFLALPYETVDVNVHPRKEQVSFIDNRFIADTVKLAVTETLKKHNLTFHALRWKIDPLYDPTTEQLYSPRKGNLSSFAGQLLKDAISPWDMRETTQILQQSNYTHLHNLYIVTQTKNGIVFVDQHAAHERILYEQFAKNFEQKKQESYALSKPYPLRLPVTETVLLEEHSEHLQQYGFIIENFQYNTFRITHIPLVFKDQDLITRIRELLDILAKENTVQMITGKHMRMLSYLACRSAIKAGEKLTKKQCKELVEKLEQTSNNATCPHGRPTKITISLQELNRLFKRT